MKTILLLAFSLLSVSPVFAESDTCKIKSPNFVGEYVIVSQETKSLFGLSCTCSTDFYELRIFDRWGNELFHSKDITETWNTKDVKDGTYVYYLDIKFGDYDGEPLTGTILVMNEDK